MSLKISHVAFCEIFVEDCNDFACAQCKDIFNAIKRAEEKFNSAASTPNQHGQPEKCAAWLPHHAPCAFQGLYCNDNPCVNRRIHQA